MLTSSQSVGHALLASQNTDILSREYRNIRERQVKKKKSIRPVFRKEKTFFLLRVMAAIETMDRWWETTRILQLVSPHR